MRHFSKDLPDEMKKKIETCLEMIGFGMKNTLVSFTDKYYEYGGDIMDGEKRGLTIGGYESAWLADLVAAYLLKQTEKLFEDFIYHGIYRDDGFLILKGIKTKREMNEWLLKFQEEINNLAESNCLQFTAEVWNIEEDEEIQNENLTIVKGKYFPYLDMEMYWNDMHDLKFKVHMKPNQVLKYLNSDSTHMPSTFRAIPNGVLQRLSKLTSKNHKLDNTKVNEIYPKHAAALKIAGIAPEVFPTFLELEKIRNKITKSEKEEKTKAKEKKRKRNTFFCIGVSKASQQSKQHPPFHAIIKKLRDNYNLKWLRISMSYHRFTNLAQAFQGDLTTKLVKNVKSLDFDDEPCNCNRASKINGECAYGGDCRKSIVIYKAECKDCNMAYLGNTQQKLKLPINQHLGEVCKLVNTGKTSDSFAKHFAQHHNNRETKLTIGEARKHVSVTILWHGNPISCNKSFGRLSCSLCMKERLKILEYSKENPNYIINSNSEFYGACRHKPKFHRYAKTTPLPVLMTNNSSERVYLTPNIP